MSPDRWVIGSLFSGIGGMPLAARWMGWDTAFVADPEPYAAGILKKHFPDAPNLGDVRTIDGTTIAPVDILTGGFPCQDISLAGKGAGITGARSGLWKEYARLIGEIRPRYVLAENVSALRTRGLDVVLEDLTALGYDAEWHCIPASAVGAPHQRDRIWILAYAAGSYAGPICTSLADPDPDRERLAQRPERDGGTQESRFEASLGSDVGGRRDDVADTDSHGLEGAEHAVAGQGTPSLRRRSADTSAAPRGAGWEAEPAVGRVAYGVPHRVDRLRCLGNSIVPQIPYLIFRAIRAVDHRQSIRLDIAA